MKRTSLKNARDQNMRMQYYSNIKEYKGIEEITEFNKITLPSYDRILLFQSYNLFLIFSIKSFSHWKKGYCYVEKNLDR
jgi:hypothetical protein